jgi:hypothetical protein
MLIDMDVIDTRNLAVSETLTVTVRPVNDAPRLMHIDNRDILLEHVGEITTVSVEANDIDTPSSLLVFSVESDNQEVIANTGLTVENTILSIRPLAQGEARITVTVSDGEKFFSTQFTVHVNLVTAIETEFSRELYLYPNPVTNDQIVIVLPDHSQRITSYRIFDARGMLVHDQNVQSHDCFECTIFLRDLRPGIYTIVCTIKDQRTQKLRFSKH